MTNNGSDACKLTLHPMKSQLIAAYDLYEIALKQKQIFKNAEISLSEIFVNLLTYLAGVRFKNFTVHVVKLPCIYKHWHSITKSEPKISSMRIRSNPEAASSFEVFR